MRPSSLLPFPVFALFIPSTTMARPQLLTTSTTLPTPTMLPAGTGPIYYDSLYSGYCAEISSSTGTTVISSYPLLPPGPVFTGTLAGTRTWSTIYPSPTPTSFPTTVIFTVIMTVTQEMWNVVTREGKAVTEGHASYVLPVVSSAYETVLETGVGRCTVVGGR